MIGSTSQAYWVTAPGTGVLRDGPVGELEDGQSLIESRFSGVSPGTERLVGRGEVPAECARQMACRYMGGTFDLPIKYGYSLVGRGIDGALAGQDVFVMHPHQEFARIRDEDAVLLPSNVSPARATLIPNTETALNAVWDADLGFGDETVIVGGGPVGLLIAFVLRQLDHGTTRIVEVDPARREWIQELPFVDAVGTRDDFEAAGHAVAFHTSGRGEGLQSALDLVGFEGKVVELSWYGTRRVTIDLGSHFHYQRKRILASQVAHVAAPRRADTTHAERMDEVLRLLGEPTCEHLLGTAVDFPSMPQLMTELYEHNLASPCPLISYS